MSKVSVIIPFFNAYPYLTDAINSVLLQGSFIAEVILVDDGSTDESSTIAKYFSKKNDYVKYYRQENQGPSVARNHGLSQARTKLVAFNDADDVWLPGKIKMQCAHLEKSNCGASITSVAVSDTNLNIKWIQNKAFEKLKSRDLAIALWMGRVSMNTPTILGYLDIFKKIGGFDETLSQREDHDFLLKIALSDQLSVLNRPTVVRRQRKDSASTKITCEERYNTEMNFFNKTEYRFPEKYHLAAFDGIIDRALRVGALKGEVVNMMRLLSYNKMYVQRNKVRCILYIVAAILPRGLKEIIRSKVMNSKENRNIDTLSSETRLMGGYEVFKNELRLKRNEL